MSATAWHEATKKIKETKFPSAEFEAIMKQPQQAWERLGLRSFSGESHMTKGRTKAKHALQAYELNKTFMGFPAVYKYQSCLKCAQKVYMQRVTLLNNEENLAFHHYYKRPNQYDAEDLPF